jgi:hypothetical protein
MAMWSEILGGLGAAGGGYAQALEKVKMQNLDEKTQREQQAWRDEESQRRTSEEQARIAADVKWRGEVTAQEAASEKLAAEREILAEGGRQAAAAARATEATEMRTYRRDNLRLQQQRLDLDEADRIPVEDKAIVDAIYIDVMGQGGDLQDFYDQLQTTYSGQSAYPSLLKAGQVLIGRKYAEMETRKHDIALVQARGGDSAVEEYIASREGGDGGPPEPMGDLERFFGGGGDTGDTGVEVQYGVPDYLRGSGFPGTIEEYRQDPDRMPGSVGATQMPDSVGATPVPGSAPISMGPDGQALHGVGQGPMRGSWSERTGMPAAQRREVLRQGVSSLGNTLANTFFAPQAPRPAGAWGGRPSQLERIQSRDLLDSPPPLRESPSDTVGMGDIQARLEEAQRRARSGR